MQISPALRNAIEQLLHGKSLTALSEQSKLLSQRYAAHNQQHYVTSLDQALTYVSMRMPSTYAVMMRVFAEMQQRLPTFSPQTLIDFGAGPGTTLWAACEIWKDINHAILIDNNQFFREIGKALASHELCPCSAEVVWHADDVETMASHDMTAATLVVASYSLGELAAEKQTQLVAQLWQRTGDMLVLIEPGTPHGFETIIAARTQLLQMDAKIFAPCPAALTCPLLAQLPQRWCHFAERVERPVFQRKAKTASLPYEDEKYSYIVLSRGTDCQSAARLVNTPIISKHQVALDLCTSQGRIENLVIKKSDKQCFQAAKKLRWGQRYWRDTLPPKATADKPACP